MEEITEVEGGNKGTRKCKKTGGKAASSNIRRYSAPQGSNLYKPCKHSTKIFFSYKVIPTVVKHLRDKLYRIPEKKLQASIIASLQ